MKTIALRFSENFSPKCGTIEAHQEVINKFGYVWYGKMGRQISSVTINELINQKASKILLIKNGQLICYWAHILEISKESPPAEEIPEYYRNKTDKIKTWFKINKIEMTAKDITHRCFVVSSGKPLNEALMHGMSPYFIIEY